MATITRFKEIKAWQKARELVREVYAVCGKGPLSKDYGLKDQLCRAASSAMTNVAEGFGRRGNREFTRFLDIARGSALEVQSLLYVALDLTFITVDEFHHLCEMAGETIALVTAFASYLRQYAPPANSELRTQS